MPVRLNDDGTLPQWRDANGVAHPTADVDALLAGNGGGHPDLAAHQALGLSPAHSHDFAASGHDHDAAYAATGHSHVGGDHPDLAGHTTLGLAASHAHPYSADDHAHAGVYEPVHAHPYAASGHNHDASYSAAGHGHPQSDVTNLTADLAGKAASGHNHDAAYATTGHTHGAQGGERFKVGDLYITTTNYADAAAVAADEGYGTWTRFGVGRFLLFTDTTAGQTAGSATHAHAFTQPSDHAALTHSGTAVANHAFTQPSGHSNHIVTQPAAHSDHASHTHQYTQVPNHVHVQTVNSATTGGLSGYTPDTSSNTPAVSGYSTQNPTGGVATGTTVGPDATQTHSAHSGTAVDAHSAHTGGAVDAHGVTQPSQHAAQAHSGGAVGTGTTDPLSITAFAWLRTA